MAVHTIRKTAVTQHNTTHDFTTTEHNTTQHNTTQRIERTENREQNRTEQNATRRKFKETSGPPRDWNPRSQCLTADARCTNSPFSLVPVYGFII